MWAFILRGLAFYHKFLKYTKFLSPTGILFRKLIGINPNSILFKKIGLSKHRLLLYLRHGQLQSILERRILTGKDSTKVGLRVLNNLINQNIPGSDFRFKLRATSIERVIFISTWTTEGIYNHKTKGARLKHGHKWYNYPLFPYEWFSAMKEASPENGYGAGSVWWATYKNHKGVASRLNRQFIIDEEVLNGNNTASI